MLTVRPNDVLIALLSILIKQFPLRRRQRLGCRLRRVLPGRRHHLDCHLACRRLRSPLAGVCCSRGCLFGRCHLRSCLAGGGRLSGCRALCRSLSSRSAGVRRLRGCLAGGCSLACLGRLLSRGRIVRRGRLERRRPLAALARNHWRWHQCGCLGGTPLDGGWLRRRLGRGVVCIRPFERRLLERLTTRLCSSLRLSDSSPGLRDVSLGLGLVCRRLRLRLQLRR